MELFRPVGEKELELIKQSGWRRFPPRLPEQPIFYPVLNVRYAEEIAGRWNTKDANSGFKGYVTRFEVDDEYIAGFDSHQVGRPTIWSTGYRLRNWKNSIVILWEKLK